MNVLLAGMEFTSVPKNPDKNHKKNFQKHFAVPKNVFTFTAVIGIMKEVRKCAGHIGISFLLKRLTNQLKM